MKLWSKTYLCTVALFMLVFYTALFLLTAPAVKLRLKAAKEAALSEEYAISRSLDSAFSTEGMNRKQSSQTFGEYYSGRGVGLYVGNEEETLNDSLSFRPEYESGTVKFTRHDGVYYICIADRLASGCDLVYLGSVQEQVNACIRTVISSVMAGAAALIAVSVLLYFLLKRINRPMERLAHELKTPLTAISGYAQMIQISTMSDEQRYEATQYIIDESRRLGEIASKLLTLSNLKDGDVNRESIEVEELFISAQSTYPNVIYEANGQRVYADRALMQSLINNLVSNALKASSEGETAELTAEKGFIRVTDHGSGMDEKQLAYVNNPNRTENPNSRNGFGIPLCHEIARLHGASLSFKSEAGRGTVATLSFHDGNSFMSTR